MYLLDRNNLGKGASTALQSFQVTHQPIPKNKLGYNIHGTPIIWPRTNEMYVYVMGEEDPLKQFRLIPDSSAAGWKFESSTPFKTSPESAPYPNFPAGLFGPTRTDRVRYLEAFSRFPPTALTTAPAFCGSTCLTQQAPISWLCAEFCALSTPPTFRKARFGIAKVPATTMTDLVNSRSFVHPPWLTAKCTWPLSAGSRRIDLYRRHQQSPHPQARPLNLGTRAAPRPDPFGLSPCTVWPGLRDLTQRPSGKASPGARHPPRGTRRSRRRARPGRDRSPWRGRRRGCAARRVLVAAKAAETAAGRISSTQLPSSCRRRLCIRLRRRICGSRRGLKASARSMIASSVSGLAPPLTKSRMRLDPRRLTSGPASISTNADKPFRVGDRKGEPIDRPHRHADQDKAVETDPVGKTPDILALGGDRIIGVGRPVAVAMAALIECDAMKFVAQSQAAQIPGMRGQGAAMQKQDRPQPFGSPIEITKSQLSDTHISLARQNDLVEAEAGAHRGRFQMVADILRQIRSWLRRLPSASARNGFSTNRRPATIAIALRLAPPRSRHGSAVHPGCVSRQSKRYTPELRAESHPCSRRKTDGV